MRMRWKEKSSQENEMAGKTHWAGKQVFPFFWSSILAFSKASLEKMHQNRRRQKFYQLAMFCYCIFDLFANCPIFRICYENQLSLFNF